jgi:hypothetical protein
MENQEIQKNYMRPKDKTESLAQSAQKLAKPGQNRKQRGLYDDCLRSRDC